MAKVNLTVERPAQDFDPTLEAPYSSGENLPACMMPDGAEPCSAFLREFAARMEADKRLRRIAGIIEVVENRCMATDGPVTATLKEMTEAEMRQIWLLASGKRKMDACFYWIRKRWSYGPGRWTVAERDEDGIFWLKGSAVSDDRLEVGPRIREPEIPDGYVLVTDGTTKEGDILSFDPVPKSLIFRKIDPISH